MLLDVVDQREAWLQADLALLVEKAIEQRVHSISSEAITQALSFMPAPQTSFALSGPSSINRIALCAQLT
ncbi:hypothetical protein RQCS_02120 [Rhodococcus qingshengii]|nr:hypothetical protein RE2895_02340 [Rhodococcus erythropolis]BCF80667.1 hypothetical protein RQCS_02120 [Rhodococcus qingshengii]GCB53810.1 hypothetical protein rerp_02180 [Rhodococcus erythropolis]SLA71162.1 Uncharacterised protein [Mycobacteroides abscessus subsp. abscessus]